MASGDVLRGCGHDHTRPKRTLSSFHEVPYYMKGNQWIKSGYRLDYSWKQTLRSVFEVRLPTLALRTLMQRP